MTQEQKNRYKDLARQKLAEINEQLTILKTMRFDKTVTDDCLLHIEAIEYRDGNIQRLQQERKELAEFFERFLI